MAEQAKGNPGNSSPDEGRKRKRRRELPDLASLFDEVNEANAADDDAARCGPSPLEDPSLSISEENPSSAAKSEPQSEDLVNAKRSKGRRPAGRTSSLFSMLEETGEAAPAQTETPAPSSQASSVPGVEDAPDLPDEHRPKQARDARDLFSLLDDGESAPLSEPRAPKRTRGVDLTGLLQDTVSQPVERAIPPALERYLAADLWRKINRPVPERRVLLNVLERVRSLLYLITTFLPDHLAQEKMRQPVPGLVRAEMLQGSLLFSDVSGFTALSEKLAVLGPEGAERLTQIMNRYFSAMLEILSWSGGILLKFAGDATLVYFPAQENGEHSNWALRAGQRMLRAMTDFREIQAPTGKVGLQMKVGVATGKFLAASVGSPKRMEYVVFGPAVRQTMAAEGKSTRGGQLILDQGTAQHLMPGTPLVDLHNGFYRLRTSRQPEPDDYEVRVANRRARGAIPWEASPEAIFEQVTLALEQIQALEPYLASELVERIVTHARKRRFDSEYRPTTVLFCNFQGLDALLDVWGEQGRERVAGLLSAYVNAMQGAIARYGGVISRIDPYSLGIKMLVLFGAPVAHEDDPQRALSAALAMNAELDVLEETWRSRFARRLQPDWQGPLLQHRIGVALGETFAGLVGSATRREYTVMGDEVNLAARLMGAAQMGQILVSQRVQEVGHLYFELVSLPAIRVKGKAKPIPIYQLAGLRADRLEDRLAQQGPLVGREMELAQAENILCLALADGGAAAAQVNALILQGPAGIGKSRLADALLQRSIQVGAEVHYARCRSYQADVPYATWGALLRAMAGVAYLDYSPQSHAEKLRNLAVQADLSPIEQAPLAAIFGIRARDLPEADSPTQIDAGQIEVDDLLDLVKNKQLKRRASRLEIFEQLDSPATSEGGQTWYQIPGILIGKHRREVYTAMQQLLSGLSRHAPQVIFFEDAHWADPATRDLLHFLCLELKGQRVFFLLARREEEDAELEEIASMLDLQPFNQEDTTNLVAALLASDLAQVIYAQSGGNPMYISQITRWFKQARNLSAEDLQRVLQSSGALQELVLSGMTSLPEIQREIVRVASVIGERFRTGEIQALTAAMVDPVSLSNHLRSLVRSRIFKLVETGADAAYHFQQPLVRDILYNSLPFEQRRSYHGRLAAYLTEPSNKRRNAQVRIARALAAQSADAPAQEAETIAYHFEQAQEWLSAASYLEKAADLRRSKQDFERAFASYSLGLDMLANLPVENFHSTLDLLQLRLQQGAGDMAVRRGDVLAAATAFDAGLGLAERLGKPEAAADLAYRLALSLAWQDKRAQAIQILRMRLDKRGMDEELACLATMAWLYWRSGLQAEAEFWAERSLGLLQELASTGLWELGVRAILAEVVGDLAAAVQHYQALNLPAGVAMVKLRIGQQSITHEQFASALDACRQAAVHWHEATPEFDAAALAYYRQAEIYWKSKELDAARLALQQALNCLETGTPMLEANGRIAIQRALRVVEKPRVKRWPEWGGQTYVDRFYITVLYRD